MDFNGKLKLLLYGPEVINRESEPVEPEEYEFLPKLKEYMTKVMRRCGGCGLAAPQVGVFRNFVIYEKNDGSIFGLVNPMIERMLGKEIDDEERCLSIPPVGNECRVPRMEIILVHASSIDDPYRGQSFKITGREARAVQQGMDLLTGTFFVDRVSPLKKKAVLEQYQSWQHNWEAAGRPFPY